MKKMVCLLIILSGMFIRNTYSQVDSTNIQYSIADTHNVSVNLFKSDDLFEISLRFDISYYKRKRSDEEYLDAILTYHTSSTDSVNKNIKVKARGIMRKEICDFPPLFLNFKMKDSIGEEFSGINKLKLVTYCKKGYQDYVLKEYLIYKLYSVLTDNSLRVRLMRVKYINTSKEKNPVTEFGFVIEPVKLLEKRTNSIEIKSVNITQQMIKPEMMDRMAIFNYMIGNTDWSVPIRHNIVAFSQPMSERPDLAMILPYDFDYSGLINADYAVPFPGLGIESVLERYYLGICREPEVIINALKEFTDKKEDFYKVINDFPYLKEKEKKRMIQYLDGFYNGIDKRNTVAYKMLQTCIKF